MNAVVKTDNLNNLVGQLASKFNLGDGSQLIETLKATAFKGNVSDHQMAALLIVANQYGLNPWTREIYAFPDRNNGIVPVVGVDGWARIMNDHPEFDGLEFEQDNESCTAIVYRKDRTRPIKVTEFKSECDRKTGPWQTHPKRMLRHKAMIQAARLAFGFTGIYDDDEAERIKDINPKPAAGMTPDRWEGKKATTRKVAVEAIIPDVVEPDIEGELVDTTTGEIVDSAWLDLELTVSAINTPADLKDIFNSLTEEAQQDPAVKEIFNNRKNELKGAK
jgi:phage recombination protein Bet